MCVYSNFLTRRHSDQSLFTQWEDGCEEGVKGSGG